ncbi:glycosyltransferase [Patescibacteria group bacterium]|nr:glycosyltransferase [Patescibacteria group bacterium]
MKVCLVSSPAIEVLPAEKMNYSGLEKIVGQLSLGLKAKGHEVTVVCAQGSYLPGIEMIESVPAGYKGIRGELEQFEKCREFILKGEFDVIDCHTHFFPEHRLLKENPAINLIWSIHDHYPLDRPSVKVPMYARSKAHAEFLSSRWGVPVSYIYNAVDLSHYQYEENKEDYLLFLGRCNFYKGPVVFAELCEKLGLRGILAGEDSELRGVPLETVKQILRIANRYPKLHYLGRVSETKKVELLSKAKALVSPLIEPYFPVFDLTNVESMACGTPVVATDRGAMREIVKDGETGFVVKSVDEIPEVLERIDEIDPSACRGWAANFSIDRMTDRYLEEYSKVSGGD